MKYSHFLIVLFFITCKNKAKRQLEPVKDLSVFPKTQFVTTLESKISQDSNAIYCATLLFAWEEIRKILKAPIEVPKIYKELNILNNSTSYKNVLKPEEYSAKGEVVDFTIIAKAEFKKNLPFEFEFEKFEKPIDFKGVKVPCFGINGNSSFDQKSNVEIIYYKNDKNFIIKLKPKNKQHELILFKSEDKFNSLIEMYKEIERLNSIGEIEKKDNKKIWRYGLLHNDILQIPKFNFNIKTNFENLIENEFSSNNSKYYIEKAWQRNGFILDEKGAIIDSEAYVEAANAEIETVTQKNLIFDNSFMIFMKRVDAKFPYFGLWVTNSNLMIK